MNREIKFRVWNPKYQFMDYNEDAVLRTLHSEFEKVDGLEVMQFTGLKDKNGKEIYEGDVLKRYDGEVSKVLWHMPDGLNNIYGFVMQTKTDGWFGFNRVETDNEVIGNIYENPELLINK